MIASNRQELKELLERNYLKYNQLDFIELDPISIPHMFTSEFDVEISAFLTASIAWGNRKSILKNASTLMALMDMAPHQFIVGHQETDLKQLDHFVHRTFNSTDLLSFIACLKAIYTQRKGLRSLFEGPISHEQKIRDFPKQFFRVEVAPRSFKHVAKISKGSAAKRLNMFLRWMVRKDKYGVDFGIWDSIDMSALYIPLDVHSGRIARSLGLLKRNQDDWKSVTLLTEELRQFDALDPVKYDYALFGMGSMP